VIGTDYIGSYKLPYDHDHDGPSQFRTKIMSGMFLYWAYF